MNRALRLLTALSLVLALGAGCKKEGKPAATTEGSAATAPSGSAGSAAPAPTAAGGDMANMTIEQTCDKAISMMEEMGKAVEANKGNCDAMGTALQKWAEDNKPFIEWGKAQDKDEAKKKEFDEKCGPRIEPAMQKIGPMMAGAQECAENEKVKAAMSSMGE